MSNEIPNNPATAAGQALGYSLQYTRLTSMLLTADKGSFCSLEVYDDVAEELEDETIKLSQTKSALKTNPVADKSVTLWKAFYNWLKLIESSDLDPEKIIFELYVSRQCGANIAQELSEAKTKDEAEIVLNKARDLFWGKPEEFVETKKISKTIEKHLNFVLGSLGDSILVVIKNFHLKFGSGSPQKDLEALLEKELISPIYVSEVANQMTGWVKRKVDKLLEQNLPAIISRDEFRQELLVYVRKIDRIDSLISLSTEPSKEEKEKLLPSKFVRQLDLIELDYNDKLSAISDFLRTSYDRTNWSELGIIHEQSLSDIEDVLCRKWKNVKRKIAITESSKSDVEKGQLVNIECMDHKENICNLSPPAHFIPGCFHCLADDLVIGWHPNYNDLINSGEKE